jgi:hypothetical protein
MFKSSAIHLGILLSFATISCAAQSQEKVYSVMMLNFARGMQWPGSPSRNFVIGVLSYPPLTAELNQTISSARVGNRKIEIREYASADEVGVCDMIFVPAFKARSFDNVLEKIANGPILVVSNKMDLAKKGAGVNFIYVDGKLKYEINCRSIEQRGIRISANVKSLGIVVD